MRKYRPPLTQSEEDELARLSGLQFSDFSEEDVREEFLAPLVRILGYRRDSDFDVLRGPAFSLGTTFVQVGRRRVKLDYLCGIRKQYFWLMEAKPGKLSSAGSPPRIAPADVLQAFFYSLHPATRCRYIVVSNGWWTNLYDVSDISRELKPLLSIHGAEVATRFLELDAYVGATQILPVLKQRILDETEKVLSAEVYMERLDEFVSEVAAAANKARPNALENSRRARLAARTDEKRDFEDFLRRADIYDYTTSIFLGPKNLGELGVIVDVLMKRLDEWQGGSRDLLFFDNLLLRKLRPITFGYHLNVLYFLLRLCAAHPDRRVLDEKRTRDVLDDWVELLLFHFGRRRELRILWGFEGLSYRLTKRILLLTGSAREVMSKRVEFERYVLPEELAAWRIPCEGAVLIDMVERAALRAVGYFIHKYGREGKHPFAEVLAMDEYAETKQTVDTLVAETEPAYRKIEKELGSDWGELMFYDSINHYFDVLGSGTCNMLSMFPEYARTLNDSRRRRIRTIAELGIEPHAAKHCGLLGMEVPLRPGITDAVREKFFDPREDPYKFTLD